MYPDTFELWTMYFILEDNIYKNNYYAEMKSIFNIFFLKLK